MKLLVEAPGTQGFYLKLPRNTLRFWVNSHSGRKDYMCCSRLALDGYFSPHWQRHLDLDLHRAKDPLTPTLMAATADWSLVPFSLLLLLNDTRTRPYLIEALS